MKTTNNSDNNSSTVAPRRPPLHPSIRVDAKTPYNAINLEAFEEDDDGDFGGDEEGIIDLTTMMEDSGKRTTTNTAEEDASFSSDSAIQGSAAAKSPSSTAAPFPNLHMSHTKQEQLVEKRDDEQERHAGRGHAPNQQQSNVTLSVNTATKGEALAGAGAALSPESQTATTEGSVVRVFSNKLNAAAPPQIQTNPSEDDTAQSSQHSSPPTSPSRFGSMFRKAALKLRERRRSPRKNRVDPIIEPITPDSNAATAQSSSSTFKGAENAIKGKQQQVESKGMGNTRMPPAYVEVKGKSSADATSWEASQTIEQHPDDEEEPASQWAQKIPPVSTQPSIPGDDYGDEEFPYDLHSMTNDSRSYPTFTGRFTPTESMSTWTGNATRRSVWNQQDWPSPHQFPPVEFTVHHEVQQIQETQSLGEAPTMDSSSVPYTKSIPTSSSMGTSHSTTLEESPYNKSTPHSNSMGASRGSTTANTSRIQTSGSYTTASIQTQSSSERLHSNHTTSTGDSRSSAKWNKAWSQGQSADKKNPPSHYLERNLAGPFAQDSGFLVSEQRQHDGTGQPNGDMVEKKMLESMRNQRANLFSSLTSVDESSAHPSSVAQSQKTTEEREERLAALRALRAKRQQQVASPVTAREGNWLRTGMSPVQVEPAPKEAVNSEPKVAASSPSNVPVGTMSMLPTVPSQANSESDDPRMAWIAALRAKRQTMLSSHTTPQQHLQESNHLTTPQVKQLVEEQRELERVQTREPIRYPHVETVTESKSMTTEMTADENTTSSSQTATSPAESDDATTQSTERPPQNESDEIIHLESNDQAVIDVDSMVPTEVKEEPKYRLPSTLRWNRMPPPVLTNVESITRSERDEKNHARHNIAEQERQIINVQNKRTIHGHEQGSTYFSETPRSDVAVQPNQSSSVIQISSEEQEDNIIEIVSDDQDDVVLLEPDGVVLTDDSSRTGWYQYDDFGDESSVPNELAVIRITQSIEDTVCGSVKSKKTVTFQDTAENGAEEEQEETHQGASVASDSQRENETRRSADPIAIIHVSPATELITYKTSKSHPVDPLPSQDRPRYDPPTVNIGSEDEDTSDGEEMQPIVVDRENDGDENKRMGVLQRARAVLAAQGDSRKFPKNSRGNVRANSGREADTSLPSDNSTKDSIIDLIRMEEEIEEEEKATSDRKEFPTQPIAEGVDHAIEAPRSPVITESQTGDEPDSPFENIRRRLVRLDIEDFRSVVMTKGGKGQGAKLDEHLRNLVNKDEDSEGKRKSDQLVGEQYSHDLALSDCDSRSEDDEKKSWTKPKHSGGNATEKKQGVANNAAVDTVNATDKTQSDEATAEESYGMHLDGLPGPNPTDEITLQGDKPSASKSVQLDPDATKVSGTKATAEKVVRTLKSNGKTTLSKNTTESKEKETEEKISSEIKMFDEKSNNEAVSGLTSDMDRNLDMTVEESSIEKRTDDILKGLERKGLNQATKTVSRWATQPVSSTAVGSKKEDTSFPSDTKATHNSNARVRFEDNGTEPLNNITADTHRQHQMSEIDDETDLSDTRDSVTKVSYLETDDESDLETAFESSTVPLLVRMLDRSCAWLEDSNTCGLGPQPSLLKQTTRVRPTTLAETTQPRRSKKQHINSSQRSVQSQQSSLPSNLPKSSSKASKTNRLPQLPLLSKLATTTAEQSVQESEEQILGQPDVSTKDANVPKFPTIPAPKSNRPKFNRKVRKGPRSTKKAKTMFDLPMFKSGADGEYKLSSGFFNKASDSSSLETMTDTSSYDNPIRLEGLEELSKAGTRDDDDYYNAGSPTGTPKISNLKQETTETDWFAKFAEKSSATPFLKATPFLETEFQPQHQFDTQVKKDFPEDDVLKKPARTLRFETEKVETSQKVLDVTSNQYYFNGFSSNKTSSGPRPEKEELSFSPRKQGLPPSPNANRTSFVKVDSNVYSDESEMMTFQDKLQMRLTRVREIAPTLLEDSDSLNGGEFYAGIGSPEAREPDEEIAEPVCDNEEAEVAHPVSKTKKNHNYIDYSENPKSDEENNQGNSTASRRSQSETERLAALALAEKLRQRAARLKEKRRQRETGQQGTRSRKRPEDRPREPVTA
eukprot:scaffold2917_cov191-Amphora_coffeaeformis.AAC.8